MASWFGGDKVVNGYKKENSTGTFVNANGLEGHCANVDIAQLQRVETIPETIQLEGLRDRVTIRPRGL